jgi:DNA-directed RNA polymerase subunit E"
MSTKQKACKKCKIMVEGDTCPICSSNQLTDTWKGKIIVLNPEKSEIAQKIGAKQKGVFALKTR